MGKDNKRKARLNKGEAGEFIGFGAFATMTTPASSTAGSSTTATAAASSSVTAASNGPGETSSASFTITSGKGSGSLLSPVYVGSDPDLNILFPRISQKRDATTKAKALSDLLAYFNDTTKPRKQQVDALSHFLYLYTTKLHYQHDSQTSSREIRSTNIKILKVAHQRLPKAFVNLTQSNPIILGMVVCTRCDPATEVRAVATEFVNVLLSETTTTTTTTNPTISGTNLDEGVWTYVHKILSYTKPLAMYQDLFQRGGGGGGGGGGGSNNNDNNKRGPPKRSDTSSSSSSSLSERNMEEMEEKYERIVSAALDGLNLYLQEPSVLQRSNARSQPVSAASDSSTDDTNYDDHQLQRNVATNIPSTPGSIKYVWKAITSTSAPIRRKTYTLLSTFCQRLPYLLDDDKTSKMIQQSLSSEKEPVNVAPSLLETLLAFVASKPKSERSTVMAQYSKALSKLFKKGCYGASASSWCQMILPIVALLPAEGVTAPQANVLTSVWEGRTYLVGVAETLDLIHAVVETSTFLLVQQQPNEFDEVIASCWIQSLQEFLTSDIKTSGAVVKARQSLSMAFAKSWTSISKACVEKTGCSIFAIRQWFWSDQVPKVIHQQNVNRSRLTILLDHVHEQVKEQPEDNDVTSTKYIDNFSTPLRQKFYDTVAHMDDKDKWKSDTNTYRLCIAILHLISPNNVFVDENSLSSGDDRVTVGRFVLNKLLPWIIRHTSTLSNMCNPQVGKLEGEFFLACIEGDSAAMSSETGSLTETVMKEVIAAKPDVTALWDYILLYATCCHWTANDFLDLEYFQAYCCSTVNGEHKISGIGADESNKTIDFLLNIVGLGNEQNNRIGLLVSDRTLLQWIDIACPKDSSIDVEPNLVLDVLIQMVKADKPAIDERQVSTVIMQAWRQGGILWSKELLPWLLATERRALCSAVMTSMKEELMQQVLISEQTEQGKATTWVDHAFRLLQLCRNSEHLQGTDDNSSSIPLFSLSTVGLGDIGLWEENVISQNVFLADCLLGLLREVNEGRRWELFLNSDRAAEDLLVAVLLYLSGGSTNPLQADSARCCNDYSARCLELLHLNRSQDDSLLKAAEKASVLLSTHLVSSQNSAQKDQVICRNIAVLSQLTRFLFAGLRTSDEDFSSDETVSEDNTEKGKTAWYIPDSDKPLSRVKCIIVKVHKDLPDEVYFTIQIPDADGEKSERQTLGSRLRLNESPKTNEEDIFGHVVDVSTIRKDEKESRNKLAESILDSLGKPLTFESWSDPCFEIYNIVLSQVGLLGTRGLGTMHYNLVQNISAIQTSLLTSLESPEPDKQVIAETLLRLSWALGWGMNTPSSKWTISLLGINASDTLPAILAYLGDPEGESTTELDCAAVAWLSVASFHCVDNNAIRQESFSTLFQTAARLLRTRNTEYSGFDYIHYMALRGIEIGQIESHKSKQGESSIQDTEAEALSELITTFAETWVCSRKDETGMDFGTLVPNHIPIFHSVMEASLKERPQLIAAAARRCLNQLNKDLYDEAKRLYAMRILVCHGNEGRPIHSVDDYDIINPATNKELREWSNGLSQEEAEMLEDNIFAVAQWTCAGQMNDIESWHVDDDIDDIKACGRMFSWLSFLNIVDAASIEDSVFYRPSFTRYVSMCKSVDAMLDLALIYGNIGSNRKVKLDKVGPLDEIICQNTASHLHPHDLSKLAALVIFRSIELFPTLCKNWWDTECPGYAKQAVQDFVESEVSPQILKRALESIAHATAFGEMKVKGSVATRQVTASYMQDDFTLSVAIELPAAYPFRRAMVDCSKTLGVPESRWKRWSLQITQMLNNQGGTLKEALLFWKDNVDKEFEGVEPCPVCYNVLHVQNHKQPNIECRTCSNRFHFLCLETWFRQSGKNNCVICQQPWSGVRV